MSFSRVYHEALSQPESLADHEKVRWYDLMHFLLSWAMRRRPEDEVDKLKDVAVGAHTDQVRNREVEKMSDTLGQTWDERVQEEITVCRDEGRTEGELHARREDLQALLEESFGQLPDKVLQAIATTRDVERLKTGIRQVLRIESLDELKL